MHLPWALWTAAALLAFSWLFPPTLLRSSNRHHGEQDTCFDVSAKPTPDPHFTYAYGKFYLTFTANDRIPVWDATKLEDFFEKTNIGPVWRPLPNTPQSSRLWAAELHALNQRWVIYYAAADPALGNKSHRMYVLGGLASTGCPHACGQEGSEFLGLIKGMDQRQSAIDGTVFKLDGKLYFVYSGWPVPPEREWGDVREDMQQLFILPLADPVAAEGEAVCISRPDMEWESSGPVRIQEGPQWLESPMRSEDSVPKWMGLVYSCATSWTQHYKMATLW